MDASFHELKKSLEASCYSAPLGIESVPLVRQLFHDIEKIRSERNECLQQNEEAKRSISQLSNTANSLRRENENLIEAKNALHVEICRNSELIDEVERKSRDAVSLANATANNYRFQLNTAIHQVKAQETDIIRLKEKVMSLLERSHLFAEADSVSLNAKQTVELGDERFEKRAMSNESQESPRFAELLEIAQSKIDALQDQVAHLNNECDRLKEQKLTLEKAISIRDAEIRRKETESVTRSLDDRKCRQLSEQVDFLTKEMITLESELKKYRAMEPLIDELQKQRDNVSEALKKSQQEAQTLRDELTQEKKAVLSLVDEKQRDLHSNKARIPRAVKDLEAAQNNIRRLQGQIKELEKEKKEIEQEHLEVKKIYQSYSSDKALLLSLVQEAEKRASETQQRLDELTEQCDSLKEQNSKLTTQLQTLRQSAQSFKKEIELHQQTIAEQQADLSKQVSIKESWTKTISSLEQTIEALSRDGEILAQKLEQANNDNRMLRETIQDQVSVAASDARKDAADKNAVERQMLVVRSLQAERDQYWAQATDMNDLLTQLSAEKSALERDLNLEKQSRTDAEKHLTQLLRQEEDLRTTLCQRDASILDLKRELQELGHELGDKQQEIATLKNLCSSSGTNTDRLRETTARCIELQREISVLKQDGELKQNEVEHLQKQLRSVIEHREALTVVLREFDAHFVSIQLQLQNLIRERDDLQFRNSQLFAELNVREHSESDFQSRRQHEQQLLSQLKSDNASLVAVVRQHEDNARNNEALLKELRADLNDLQSSRESLLRDLQNERRMLSQATARNGELESQLDLAKQDLGRMTKQITMLQHTIEQHRGTISTLRGEADQLQSLITQLENVKTSESAEVARLRSTLQAVRDDISQKEQQISELQIMLSQSNNQLDSLKHVAQNLDMERDRLCHLLDEKCEQLAQAQQHLKDADEAVIAAQHAATQLQERFDELSAQHATTLESLRQQKEIVEQMHQNEQSLEAQVQLKNSEVYTLTEDLKNMTCENQFVNGELTLALQEKDAKAQEAFAAVSKVLYLEELLRVQKHEKEDLLNNYRLLSSENKRLLDTASELDSKCQKQLLDVQRLTERCLIAESKCKELSDNNGRLALDVEQYQRSQERLTRSLATLQEQLDASRYENSSLKETLNSSRSLSIGLESDRENLQRRLLLDQDSRNRFQNEIQELESQLQSQLHQNQFLTNRVNQLEVSLDAERAKSPAPDTSSEIQRLQDEVHRREEENTKLKQYILEYEKKLSEKERDNDKPSEVI